MSIEVLIAMTVGFSILPLSIILSALVAIRSISSKRTKGLIGVGSILLLPPAHAAAIGFNVYGASLYRLWWYAEASGDVAWGPMAKAMLMLSVITMIAFIALLVRLFDLQ